jgi:hypothetical protein
VKDFRDGARNPSLKVGRPWGMIMNSGNQSARRNGRRPLMTLAIGTGQHLGIRTAPSI